MSGLQSGYVYAAPMPVDQYWPRPYGEPTYVPVPVPYPQPIDVGKGPTMLEQCRQRRDELKAELETLEAMIAAAEKAGAK